MLTLSDSVATHARLTPQRLAARDSRRQLCWADWDERATRLATGLLALDLAAGDRVVVLAHNALEWLEIYTALDRGGLVAVPINFRLRGAEIAYIVGQSGMRALIAHHELVGAVESRRAELPVAGGRYVRFGGGGAAPVGWVDYEALIAGASPASTAVPGSPGDLFALMYTSGTTGRPKGAMRSHAGNALLALATALEFGLSRDDTGLLVMPLCHANSLYFMLTLAMLGATTVVGDRRSFDAEALLALLARDRISFTSLVPTHYTMMLDLPAAAQSRYDLAAVDKLLISSAPAREDTKLAIMDLFPNSRLFELYGSTEAGWVTVLRPHEQLARLGSVGREWTGSGPIRLLDADGREVPDGEIGELHSRTSYVFDGYWNDPVQTAAAFRGAWCSVGDMARRDADGFIHLADRKSNMIISGGENVYPSEVEQVLAGHPAVQDVAVVGLTDAKWGEAVCAVVVLRPGVTAPESALIEWCRDRIAGYKRPRHVHIIAEAEMPRTATGKIQHRVLRDRLTGDI